MSNPAESLDGTRRGERPINAPTVVVGLIVVLIALHGLRLWTGTPLAAFAISGQDLRDGYWAQLVTYQFVHGSWAHVMMNSAFVLAFGAPVARHFGESPRGVLIFLLYFLVCGVIAALGFGALLDGLARLARASPGGWSLVGASGAASGLMGGAIRLVQGGGQLGPLAGRTVLGASAGWIVINAVLGLAGLTPGVGAVPVAWQAHIVGYFAGLLLIGVFGRLAGRFR